MTKDSVGGKSWVMRLEGRLGLDHAGFLDPSRKLVHPKGEGSPWVTLSREVT